MSLKAQHDALLLDPVITNLRSNTINNQANSVSLFASIASTDVEVANNTTHIGHLYANSANQQTELQGLTVSVNTLQNNVANNLSNIVNNYAHAGNNAAEILLLQSNAVNLTANVVQSEYDIANNAANITILQANTIALDANAVAQEVKISTLTTDATNLRINVVSVESDTANNTIAIDKLIANTSNLIANAINTANVTSGSSNAIANLVSNVASLEILTGYHDSNITALWAANTATYTELDGKITDLKDEDTDLTNYISALQTIVGTTASLGLQGKVGTLETDLPAVKNDIDAITTAMTSGGHASGMAGLVQMVYNNDNDISSHTSDINQIRNGQTLTFQSHPDLVTAQGAGMSTGELYIDSTNNVIKVIP